MSTHPYVLDGASIPGTYQEEEERGSFPVQLRFFTGRGVGLSWTFDGDTSLAIHPCISLALLIVTVLRFLFLDTVLCGVSVTITLLQSGPRPRPALHICLNQYMNENINKLK